MSGSADSDVGAGRRRMLWWAVASVLSVVYVLSPVPTLYVAMSLGVDPRAGGVLFSAVYAPVHWACDHWEFVDRFYDWQYAVASLVFH